MQVKFTNRGTTLTISITGELDHHSADYMRQKIDGELIKSSNKNVIMDFTNVSFMDSSGIGVIMGRYKMIQKLGGKFVIAGLNPQIKRILEMAGLFRFIPAFDDIESANKYMMSI